MDEKMIANNISGLSIKEVEESLKNGQNNKMVDENAATTRSIIRQNIFTYFNLIFAIISLLLIIAGSFKSLTFLPVIIINIIIGIAQQLRSKKVLDQLNVISKSSYQVIRDGKYQSVPIDELVLDDIILLDEGRQIPADATLVDGKVSVNESLLTGEEDEIEKVIGSDLKSGSSIISGKCLAKLTAVGNDSYAAKLTQKAKEVKHKKTDMIRALEGIIKFAGIIIIPIGITLFSQSLFLNHKTFSDSIVSTVGALIGMIPEGLYLLVTVALAISAMKLARKKVLLHDMKGIESLARVDILCVDKTGTITANKMTVTDLILPEHVARKDLTINQEILSKYINIIPDSNITMLALREYFTSKEAFKNAEATPFSSKVKYSQIKTEHATYRLGAPDILLNQDMLEVNQTKLTQYASDGKRILALVEMTKDHAVPLLFVAIQNDIRANAKEIFSFFNENDVAIKVISGDNPLTVSRIANQAGILDSENYIDASTLKTKEDIEKAALNHTIFGRVTPEQKKDLVLAFKKSKYKVAMTGDGVNDILAMKEADCSIAMGSGSEAARQAAQVVLLDSDFSRMKDIVSQGRQIINNITRSATLFLYKNIFSMLLAIFSIITIFTYPLAPTQVSLISMFNIGIPAFLLSLETNTVKKNQNFLKETILTPLPASLTSFSAIACLVVFGQLFDIPQSYIGIASTYLLAVVGFLILRNVSRPLNKYKISIFITCFAGFIICSLIPSLRSLFMLNEFSNESMVLCLIFALSEVTVMRSLTSLFENIPSALSKCRLAIQKLFAD
ncbi:cation-transporting ATPase [Streptococcus infantarius subsp. infantarius]|uniref:HAD-IC family P-type ATPase n=1 Tax=uncultured Streptococcus sp. TaxID=83427 RepID=UPI00208EED84|nr:HAD-IC family P-type ATPase [uncultured Streptococcus sp.]MCO4596761.1 cation-transporting ATPase [Streptococcus infantarius subsp. infantarius]